MSKYYTPNLEEFHVGFRFEYREHDKWISTDLLGLRDRRVHYLKEMIANERVRTKYLDKADIEELGWVQDQTDSNIYVKNMGSSGIDYYDLYIDVDNKWHIDAVWKEHGVSGLYWGTIKNYNELKKVMQMLGI